MVCIREARASDGVAPWGIWLDLPEAFKFESGGRAGSQTRICSFGRCRVVRLHYPPSGTRAGNPTQISSLGPKRHHPLDHIPTLEAAERFELSSSEVEARRIVPLCYAAPLPF